MYTKTEDFETAGRIIMIPLGLIVPNPNQPRRRFNSETLLSLSESIRANGVMQPVTVRALDNRTYELIAGERRLRAARLAGLDTVPCIKRQVLPENSALLALLENLQRENLSVFEEAEGLSRLIQDWGITQREAAERLGKAQSTLANKLRLLQLTPPQREQITAAALTERHARALLRIPSAEIRDNALTVIVAREYNVQDTERYIDALLAVPEEKTARRRIGLVKDVRLFVNTITRAIDVMRQQGLDALSSQNETEDYIEYTVRIPKSQARPEIRTNS